MRMNSRRTLCIALLALASCDELERPQALEPNLETSLLAEVVRPRTEDNTTVIAGRLLFVSVRGSEVGGRLTGLGVHVLRQPGRFVDSIAVSFPAAAESTHVFSVMVPDSLPSNSQLELTGIAFGVGGATQVSEPEAVIVLRCPPQATWCN